MKGPVCGQDNCPSTQYHEENGFWTCSNGHQRDDIQIHGDDEDAFGTQGRKHKRKAEAREKVYQHLQGRKAFEHYLICYELILRKQCWWLMHSKGLPAELEQIVYGLWALRLTTLKDRVDSLDTSDTETHSQTLYSSQSETEPDVRQTRRGKKHDATPTLVQALGLCYLATIILRLPKTIGEFHTWAASGSLLYHTALKSLPPEMLSRLPGPYHEALDPQTQLHPDALRHAVADLALTYQSEHGMQLPALNRPLLSFRLIKDLALPLDIYAAVPRLAEVVGYSLAYPPATTRRLKSTDMPEVQLVCLLVVAAKLLYPFDGVARVPRSATEPAAAALDWGVWAQATAAREAALRPPQALTFEEAMEVKEDDVFAMDEERMDAYLDFYERTFVDEEVREGSRDAEFRRTMFEMFPTVALDASGQQRGKTPDPSSLPVQSDAAAEAARVEAADQARLEAVQSSLKIKRPVPEGEEEKWVRKHGRNILRPGSQYKRFRRVEEVQGPAKVFFEAAARLAGMSLEALVRAVFATEVKLQRWVDGERRREREGERRGREGDGEFGEEEGG